MTDIDLELPAFLRIPAHERAAAWKGRRLTSAHRAGTRDRPPPWGLPKSMDATARKLLAAAEAEKLARKQERLASLRAWKEANR